MEKRPIVYGYEQARTFDYLSGLVYALEGDSRVSQDLMGGSGTTVVSGGAATPNSPATMSINIAPISIYQMADVDATAYGALAANTAQILQIGRNDASTSLTFSTSALTSGQSQWALVEASLLTSDSVAPNDPNSGLLLYYNATNPSQPYQGQNNNGLTQNTLRSNTVALSIVYGAVASSGSEIPPSPSSGSVPLYLVDLTYGQTQITNIITAGPSAATNVPSNYPYAPFLAGLLNSHHSGGTGQAPKVNLATETQGNFNRIVQGVTPPQFDSSLNLATTAWFSSKGIAFAEEIALTASTTLTASQAGNLIYANGNTAAITITLPLSNGATVGQMVFPLINLSAYTVTVAASGTDTLNIPTTTIGPYQSLMVVNDGVSAWDFVTGSVGNANSPLTVGNATAGTQDAVPISQGDTRYGPIQLNTISAATTLTAAYQGSLNNITAVVTTTLPALSSLTAGQTYAFRIISEVINAPVESNAADTMTVNGVTGLTSFPVNPGGELLVVGTGGTAGAWVGKYVPAAEAFLNTASSDIVLHVGERCYYGAANLTSLALHIATLTYQSYRLRFNVTGTGTANATQLLINNTSYSGSFATTELLVSSSSSFVGSWAVSTNAININSTASGLTGQAEVVVNTTTDQKRGMAISYGYSGSTGYMGILMTTCSDTTTLWTSLGTISAAASNLNGIIEVERIL